jgi:MFS family permease
MTTLTVLRSAARSVTARAERRHLPTGVAFYLLASILVFFLAGSSTPTPLYSTYAREWGFSPITTTIVFGVYALAVLAALLTAGSLSDHVGRRPVLLATIAVQAAAMIVFVTADGVPALLVARVVQGLATGAAAAAVGAAMLDLDQVRGTIANSVAAPLGTGLGAIGAGIVVQFLPAPTHLVYLVLLGIFAVQAVGVLAMADTVSRKRGALASLRPEFALPRRARGPLLLAAPALVAAWALAGFYASLGPTLIRTLSGSTSLLVGGLPLFALAAGGAAAVFALRKAAPRRVMMFGTAALAGGVAATLAAVEFTSTAGFFLATVVAGVGFGAAFQGGIRIVVPLAHPHERAGLLSVVYVVSYLALGVPAVLGGLLAAHNGDVLLTAREYGTAVIVLAGLAAAGLLRRPRPVPPPAPLVLAAEARELCEAC